MAADGGVDALVAEKLRAIDWGDTMKRLVDRAHHFDAPGMSIEDLAQEAVRLFFKNDLATWDHEADPTAYRTLLYKMWNHAKDVRTKEDDREEKVTITHDSDAVDATPPESDENPERALETQSDIARKLATLRAALKDSPVTLALVELCTREGMLAPKQVAERLGVSIREVYVAEDQLRRHIRRMAGQESEDKTP